MKVYIVCNDIPYNASDTLGVFLTEQMARQFIYDRDYGRLEMCIEVWDAEINTFLRTIEAPIGLVEVKTMTVGPTTGDSK